MNFSIKNYSLRVWSKIIILSAPELPDTEPEKQEEVEDMAPKMFRYGPQCVIYNLSFSKLWNNCTERKNTYSKYVLGILFMKRKKQNIKHFQNGQ